MNTLGNHYDPPPDVPSDIPELSQWRRCGTQGWYERIGPPHEWDAWREFAHPTRDELVLLEGKIDVPPDQNPVAFVHVLGLDMVENPATIPVEDLVEQLVQAGRRDVGGAIGAWGVLRGQLRAGGKGQEEMLQTFETQTPDLKERILTGLRWLVQETLRRNLFPPRATYLQMITYPRQERERLTRRIKDRIQDALKKKTGMDAIVTDDPTLEEGIRKALAKLGIDC